MAKGRVLRFAVGSVIAVSLATVSAFSIARAQQSSAQNSLPPSPGASAKKAATSLPATASAPPIATSSAATTSATPVAATPKLADGTVYSIAPSDADPQIKRFNSPNLVLFKDDVTRDAPLLVVFSGTGGTAITSWLLLKAGADAGYRVIGLTYDNAASVPASCGNNPDPACSDHFRDRRIFGEGTTKDIDDTAAESVLNRLTKLLVYLDAHHGDQNWRRYLRRAHGEEQPYWERIAFAGHSQGGGVAAYIAKRKKVARVIVLSGAWDRSDVSKQWAAWITATSATPMTRWYAAYHEKESRADAMKAAYAVMGIPEDHIRVMTLEPNPALTYPAKMDVYHASMISERSTPRDKSGDPAYEKDWEFFLGGRREQIAAK